MVVVHRLPDLDQLNEEALRALVVAQHQQIEHLKLLIAQLRRMQFGRKSEKLTRQIEQLELQLEDLEAKHAKKTIPSASKPTPAPPSKTSSRRPLPSHLPRVTHTHTPKEDACPGCGGQLRKLGDDISEMLEYVPAHFHVIRHVRPKFSCAHCERIVQAPAPTRPIERGLAGPGLLAHVLVSKYCDYVAFAVM
jgi:transposase